MNSFPTFSGRYGDCNTFIFVFKHFTLLNISQAGFIQNSQHASKVCLEKPAMSPKSFHRCNFPGNFANSKLILRLWGANLGQQLNVKRSAETRSQIRMKMKELKRTNQVKVHLLKPYCNSSPFLGADQSKKWLFFT